MTLSPDRQISVFPNPYHALDAYGHPAAAVQVEPDEGGFTNASHRGYVGARVDTKRSHVLDAFGKGDPRSAREVILYEFETKHPTLVPISTYYLERIREGSLIAADKRAASLAGVKFLPPDEVLAQTKDAARTTWKEQTGQDLPSADSHAPEEVSQ